MTGEVERGDYRGWCEAYGYDPDTEQARQDWAEAREALAALQRAAAGAEAREAIDKARGEG